MKAKDEVMELEDRIARIIHAGCICKSESFPDGTTPDRCPVHQIVKLIEIAIKKERETCAQICERHILPPDYPGCDCKVARLCADEIRKHGGQVWKYRP